MNSFPDESSAQVSSRRQFLQRAALTTAATGAAATALRAETVKGKPVVVRTKDVMQREPQKHLWTLHQSATSRTNLVEMSGGGGRHFHPDAEHSLYVISGEVTATVNEEAIELRAGDYISIPAGVPHGYTVAEGKTALLISMDAPPYDPAKTVRIK